MIGKTFLNKHLLLFWLAFSALVGVAAAAERGPAVVLLSSEEEAYRMPAETFAQSLDLPVEVVNLHGDIHQAPAVMHQILAKKPSLIFALGAKAAYIAKTWTSDHQNIPVLFAMVLNWQRYGLLKGQGNVAGIASEVAPGTQFLNMTLFAPEAKRIGVIYSKKHSADIIAEARGAAARLGLHLVEATIQHPKEFRRAFKKMAGRIDSFWIISDPVVYTVDNITWLQRQCIQHRIVCIGQSRNVAAKLGVLLAVEPDIPNIGSQAASMAKRILFRHQSPKNIGVRPPLGTKLFLNRKTAQKIELPISPAAMNIVSEVLDK